MTLGRRKLFTAVAVALTVARGAGAIRRRARHNHRASHGAQERRGPLADVRLILIGTSLSGTTSEDGKFSLNAVPAGTIQVQAVRVGYQSQKKTVTVTAGASVTADFVMTVAVAQLEEVVTTATGQARKVELGNALSTVDVAKAVEDVRDLDDRGHADGEGAGRRRPARIDARRCADRARPRRVVDQPDATRRSGYVDGVRISTGTLTTGHRHAASRCSTRSTPTRSRTSRS